jgi:hypothetical protein
MIRGLFNGKNRESKRGIFETLLRKPSELTRTKALLEKLQRESEEQTKAAALKISALEKEINETKEDRLKWMAKESSTRKDLLDCQERSKDLLDQVVRLTHQERLTKQTLLDQQFKTSTTPLERNRYEMELTGARAKIKEAEERATRAEEKLSKIKELEEQASRVTKIESELSWAKEQFKTQQLALRATVRALRDLEGHIIPARTTLKEIQKRAAGKKSIPTKQKQKKTAGKKTASKRRKNPHRR